MFNQKRYVLHITVTIICRDTNRALMEHLANRPLAYTAWRMDGRLAGGCLVCARCPSL